MAEDKDLKIALLEKENLALKAKLHEYGYFFYDSDQALSGAEKMQIFRQYFRCREDVFAQKSINRTTGKKQYFFVCIKKGFKPDCRLGEKGFNCGKCTCRSPKKLDILDFKRHMKEPDNDKTLGVYPLFSDNTCCFLAFDFDDDYWFECMLSLYHTCIAKGITPLLERSQSGNGGHLWLFFQIHVPAIQARNLGSYLLGEAMKSNPHITFNSYDRMFPSQDVLTGPNGMGNCIALPLAYDAYLKGNSAFIDEHGVVIDHPIEYLQTIPMIEDRTITSLLNSYEGLENFFMEQDQLTMKLNLDNPYTESFEAICDSRIHISKRNLNAITIRDLRKIGSMPNPKFYERQRQHLYIKTEDTPRILSEVEETDRELFLPRGTQESIEQKFAGCSIKWTDHTCVGTPLDLRFTGELRPDQLDAVKHADYHDIGIFESPTGSGKTVMALYIAARKQVSTLIILPKLSLIEGWKEKAHSFLSIPVSESKRHPYIGELSGQHKKLNYHLDIAMINSLARTDDLPELFSHYGMVIIDECQHVASDMFRSVLKYCSSKYIYSFSATPEREDKLDRIMFMYCGKVIYKASKATRLALLDFDKVLVKQMTAFKPDPSATTYQQVISQMAVNQRRNNQIFRDISRMLEEGRHILVLSDRREHLNTLFDMVQYKTDQCYLVTGITGKKERKKAFEDIEKCTGGFVLFSTISLLSEGYDLPALDTLFLTIPIKWKGRLVQSIGRIHRGCDGKTLVKVYDYVDYQCPMFQNMFKYRLKEYYDNNYRMQEESGNETVDNKVFNRAEYFAVMSTDIANAHHSVYISTEDINLDIYKTLMESFDSAQRHGAFIKIDTNSHQDNLEEIIQYINGLSIDIQKTDHVKMCMIIDQCIVWHGTFGIIDSPKADDYLIRLDNKELAEEIYEK
jgi:superfamily II DNA or RNA helicase